MELLIPFLREVLSLIHCVDRVFFCLLSRIFKEASDSSLESQVHLYNLVEKNECTRFLGRITKRLNIQPEATKDLEQIEEILLIVDYLNYPVDWISDKAEAKKWKEIVEKLAQRYLIMEITSFSYESS